MKINFKNFLILVGFLGCLFNVKISALSDDLLCAIEKGDINSVKNLIKNQKEIEVEPDLNGRTAIMYACICNKPSTKQILEILLCKGMQFSSIDKFGYNAFAYADLYNNSVAREILQKYRIREMYVDEHNKTDFMESTQEWVTTVKSKCPTDIDHYLHGNTSEASETLRFRGSQNKHNENQLLKCGTELKTMMKCIDDEICYDENLSEIFNNAIDISHDNGIACAKLYAYFRISYEQLDHRAASGCVDLFKKQVNLLRKEKGVILGGKIDERDYSAYVCNYIKAVVYCICHADDAIKQDYKKLDRISRDYALRVINGINPDISIPIDPHHSGGIFGCLLNPLYELIDNMNDTLYSLQNLKQDITEHVLSPMNTCINEYTQVGYQLNDTVEKLDDRLLIPLKEFITGPASYFVCTYADSIKLRAEAEANAQQIRAYGDVAIKALPAICDMYNSISAND